MKTPALAPVEQQIRRVSRRLFVQTLLDRVVWCWAGALVLAVAWFLVQPLLFAAAEEWVRWAAAGGVVGAATLLAVVLARLRAPSRLDAALALDEQFGLKERVTTSLGLDAEQLQSPAAEALLADVNRRVAGLDVPSHFPVRLSWSAALVPVGAAALALVAFFYEPGAGRAMSRDADADKLRAETAKEIEDKLAKLKRPLAANWPKDQPKSEELKELEKAWEKLLKEPLDPNDKEKIRERIQAMKPLEEKMKDRIASLKAKADKGKQLKDLLKNLNADPNGKREGPGKDLEDALAKGNLEKAANELEKLRKKLEQDKLNPEERKKIEDQLRDLEQRLKRLVDREDIKEKLRDALKKGELEREQFDEQMEKLAEDAADNEELQDLANRLGECLKCLKKGNRALAAKRLKALIGKLMELDPDAKELKELENNEAALCEACQALLQGLCDGQCNGLGQGDRPGTKRPMGKDAAVQFKRARQKAEEDDTGQYKITGFRKGGSFRKIPAREVGGAFRQAVQEAPSAIERQRVPLDAAEILKGYYENLGGQK